MIGQKLAVKLLMGYLADKTHGKAPRMFSLAEKRPEESARRRFRRIKALLDEGSNWRLLVENLFREVDLRLIRSWWNHLLMLIYWGARAQAAAKNTTVIYHGRF